MSIVSLTRITPADLQYLQTQANVGSNGTIAHVIQSLQFNRTTQQAPLNTNCPTCVVGDVVTGFVPATLGNVTMNVPCPTCKGYLLYHTAQGAITPPANPFNGAITSRLLPADLKESAIGFPGATTLSAMTTALQANFAEPLTINCPTCTHTGWLGQNGTKRMCWTCSGWQKLAKPYPQTPTGTVNNFSNG